MKRLVRLITDNVQPFTISRLDTGSFIMGSLPVSLFSLALSAPPRLTETLHVADLPIPALSLLT